MNLKCGIGTLGKGIGMLGKGIPNVNIFYLVQTSMRICKKKKKHRVPIQEPNVK